MTVGTGSADDQDPVALGVFLYCAIKAGRRCGGSSCRSTSHVRRKSDRRPHALGAPPPPKVSQVAEETWHGRVQTYPVVSGAGLVLLVGVPRDLEEMTIGIGEVPGVDAERAHMSGRGQRTSGGFDLPEQLVDLCL
jgi:hypothetical protein